MGYGGEPNIMEGGEPKMKVGGGIASKECETYVAPLVYTTEIYKSRNTAIHNRNSPTSSRRALRIRIQKTLDALSRFAVPDCLCLEGGQHVKRS